MDEWMEQCICDNGHLTNRNACRHNEECPICRAQFAFWNLVLDPTGKAHGVIIDFSPLVIKTAKGFAQFRVPTAKELKCLRSYYDEEEGRYKLVSNTDVDSTSQQRRI